MSGYVYDCEVLVVEAGSGAILLRGIDSEFGGEVSTWLRGSDVGTALSHVTTLALADEVGPHPLEIGGFGLVSRREALRLLPRLVRATVMAAATADKYEVMMLRGPENPPAEPFCHGCGASAVMIEEGREWAEECTRREHQVFGAAEDETWEEGLKRHRREASRWQFRSDMGLIPPMTGLAP